MPWPITANPVRFEEAEEWFRNRVPMTPSAYDALGTKWQRHAFKISGVSQLDLVTDVHSLLQRGIAQGATFDDYKKEILERLTTTWGGTVRNPSARLQTIVRNAHQSAYNAGRYAQMTKPAMLRVKPFWQFEAVIDNDTTIVCQERDGVVRPNDDYFWNFNIPPLHHRCRSTVRAISSRQAERAGGVTQSPSLTTPPGDGWGARPGLSEWEPNLAAYPASLRRAWKRKYANAPEVPGDAIPATPPTPPAPPRAVASIDDPKYREFIERLDRYIEEDDLRSVLNDFRPIIDDTEVRMALNTNMNEWVNTFSNSDYQNELRTVFRAWRKNEGRDSLSDAQKAIFDDVDLIMTTRRERWERRAEALGVDMPTHFRLHRGARGDIFVDDVAEAWMAADRGEDMMNARTWNMSSWSMDPKGARHFVDLEPADGVIFSADVPFGKTFADALVDDGTFVAQYMFEREVIVADGDDSPVRLRSRDVQVKLDGKTYGFNERAGFLSAWRKKRGL